MPKQPKAAQTQSNVGTGNIKMNRPEKEIASDFHLRVRKARVSKGLEQRELAKRINVRLNDIQKIEGGSVPSESMAIKIETALGVILLVEAEEDMERSVNVPSGRGMTIGDALDEFLNKDE